MSMSELVIPQSVIDQLMNTQSKREVKELEEIKNVVDEKKKRGRPKKEKLEKVKKPVGRPKSETDIKTRRMLYGLTFFSKILGVSDEVLEAKKKELVDNIKNGKVAEYDENKSDSDNELEV